MRQIEGSGERPRFPVGWMGSGRVGSRRGGGPGGHRSGFGCPGRLAGPFCRYAERPAWITGRRKVAPMAGERGQPRVAVSVIAALRGAGSVQAVFGEPRKYPWSVSYRPGAVQGVQTVPTGGRVEYQLARNAVVREFHRGRLSRLDVCDAHPELLRAARQLRAIDGRSLPHLRRSVTRRRDLRVRAPSSVGRPLRCDGGGVGSVSAAQRPGGLLRRRGLHRMFVEPSAAHVPDRIRGGLLLARARGQRERQRRRHPRSTGPLSRRHRRPHSATGVSRTIPRRLAWSFPPPPRLSWVWVSSSTLVRRSPAAVR